MGAGTSAGDAAQAQDGAPEADTADGAVVAPSTSRLDAQPQVRASAASNSDPIGRSGGKKAGGTGATQTGQGLEPGSTGPARAGAESSPTTDATRITEIAEITGAVGATAITGATGITADDEPREPARPFPEVTLDTALPEGGGRAAPGDAPAPARQWPLLSVLGTTGLGLAVVGLHPFTDAFRFGVILIGLALIGGAVLRWLLPSVGMLAVRSRFTDMLTYGVLGTMIVLLALMTQPNPWLEVPFLEDVVHSTVP